MSRPKKPLSNLDKRLDKVPSPRLYAALGRRRHRKLKEQAPEVLEERTKKRLATTAIRMKYCTHTLYQPKVRTKGPNIGLLCCPSCNVSLEQWTLWAEKARCLDPRRKGCTYEGRCWFLALPDQPQSCMECPECGGCYFEAEMKVSRSGWTGVLTGETK